jgi:hypothetical protein
MDALFFIRDIVDLTTNEYHVSMRMLEETLKEMFDEIDLERVEVAEERLSECASRIAMARAILIESEAMEEEADLSKRAISLFDSLVNAIESCQHHLVLLFPRGE